MVIVIGDSQWTYTLATEIYEGLSGVESLLASEGMLFDLGFDYSRVDINMDEMLFPLDIIFINSNLTVVGVLHDVQPGDEAYFLASSTLWARCFLEVNAGEAASVNVGDEVVLGNGLGGFSIDIIFGCMLAAVMLVIVFRMIYKELKGKKPSLPLGEHKLGNKSNPGLIRPSRAYFTPELEVKLDDITKKLYTPRQLKVNQLFEVMEDINHTRKAIQEQRSPLDPPMLLQMELRASFTHNYITHSDYNRFMDKVVVIESYMDIGQWSDALFNLNKLMFNIADAFLVDFPERIKKEIMDIVEAIWRMS